MRAASTLIAIGTALWISGLGTAHALGFGRIVNTTQLGQPLDVSAAVRIDPGDAVPRECVAAEVQSGENKLPAGMVRATLEDGANATEPRVRVTTSALIDEPVVTVDITLGCSAKVTRRFVVFVDPAPVDAGRAATEPLAALAPQRVESAVAPIVRSVEPRAAGQAPTSLTGIGRPAPQATRAGAHRSRARAPADAARPSATMAPSVAARAVSGGSRLKLDAAPPLLNAPALSAAASSPSVDAAASAAVAAPPEPDGLAAERERERIRALEDGLATLRSDSVATRQAMAALQARLQQAESERYANPLVYALGWLSALLALAVATLWWRRSRGRDAAQWWTAPVPATGRAVEAPGATRLTPASPAGPPTTAAGAFAASLDGRAEEATEIRAAHRDAASDDAMRTAPPTASTVTTTPFAVEPRATGAAIGSSSAAAAPTGEATRELSVEELIDLEQQAEFFIVLGQDEAAIELLMSHVRSDGGISPLPYLKLLEIYRRRGDREAYERIRERFNRRFNAHAADWDSDLQQGRSLPEYPETVARLQSLWAFPARAMETLDASLFRRNRSDETFELPAYRELLFLYSIARDLAEHAGTASKPAVDLLLPLDGPGADAPITRLTPTGRASGAPVEFPSSDMMTLPLDLDVSLDAGLRTAAPGSGASVAGRDAPSSGLHRSSVVRPLVADPGAPDLDLGSAGRPSRPGRLGNL